MGKTDENERAVPYTGQKSIWPPYALRIRQQQEEWDDLKTSGQESYRDKKEALEEEDADSSEAIKEYLAQHNENREKPAYLVRGADLICSQGSCKRMMNLNKCHGVYIKEHAVVHELDCLQGDRNNITWFGVCSCGEELETDEIELQTDSGETVHGKKCRPHIIGTWQEAYEGTKIVDNGLKKPEKRENLESGNDLEGCCTITTDSFLVCRHGGIILPVNSGQDREVSPDEFDYDTEEEREAALEALQDICDEVSTPEADCGDLLHARNPGGTNGNVHGSEYVIEPKPGQEEQKNNLYVPVVSGKGIMALMELEIFNTYSKKKGYLVIKNNMLTGIKPHLAGDKFITVGFGDCLQEDKDIDFYKEKGYILYKYKGDFNKVKGMVVPVEICFDKLLQDVKAHRDSLAGQIKAIDLKEHANIKSLSQQQLDALVIARYQLGSFGSDILDVLEKTSDRRGFFEFLKDKHGQYGDFTSRTNVEMNIFYDSNYEVEGGLKDAVRVEPWEKRYGVQK